MSVEEYKLIIAISVVALVLFVGLWFVFFLLSRRKTNANNTASSTERAVAARSAQLNKLIKSLDVLMDEVEASINNALKRAEYKERRLNELMRKADIIITKLEKVQVNSLSDPASQAVTKAYADHHIETKKVMSQPSSDRVSSKPKGDKFKQVVDLINQGKTISDVASYLKIDKGEVELICNLQKKIS